jgi:hypothetical protein
MGFSGHGAMVEQRIGSVRLPTLIKGRRTLEAFCLGLGAIATLAYILSLSVLLLIGAAFHRFPALALE